MTPLLAKALYADPDWCGRMAPRALRRVLEVAGGREPSGLLRDLLRFVVSFEYVQRDLDKLRGEVAEVVSELEEKLEAAHEDIAEQQEDESRLRASWDHVNRRLGEVRMERDAARKALEEKDRQLELRLQELAVAKIEIAELRAKGSRARKRGGVSA